MGGPKYEEIPTPSKPRKRAPSTRNLLGLILPGQGGCNHFVCGLSKRGRGKHPMISYASAEIQKQPPMPNQGADARSLDTWGNLQKTHMRRSSIGAGYQGWPTYAIRLILTGDLFGDWDTFGGLASQFAHLGTFANLAITGNSSSSRVYD